MKFCKTITIKEGIECVDNNQKGHLNKEYLALFVIKIEIWFMQENKWLAVVFIETFIGVVSLIVGIKMVTNGTVLETQLLLLIHLWVK